MKRNRFRRSLWIGLGMVALAIGLMFVLPWPEEIKLGSVTTTVQSSGSSSRWSGPDLWVGYRTITIIDSERSALSESFTKALRERLLEWPDVEHVEIASVPLEGSAARAELFLTLQVSRQVEKQGVFRSVNSYDLQVAANPAVIRGLSLPAPWGEANHQTSCRIKSELEGIIFPSDLDAAKSAADKVVTAILSQIDTNHVFAPPMKGEWYPPHEPAAEPEWLSPFKPMRILDRNSFLSPTETIWWFESSESQADERIATILSREGWMQRSKGSSRSQVNGAVYASRHHTLVRDGDTWQIVAIEGNGMWTAKTAGNTAYAFLYKRAMDKSRIPEVFESLKQSGDQRAARALAGFIPRSRPPTRGIEIDEHLQPAP